MAMMFLKKVDQCQYGDLCASLYNQYTRGSDQYPTNLASAYNTVNEHRKEQVHEKKKPKKEEDEINPITAARRPPPPKQPPRRLTPRCFVLFTSCSPCRISVLLRSILVMPEDD
jgi:hypothetical protein